MVFESWIIGFSTVYSHYWEPTRQVNKVLHMRYRVELHLVLINLSADLPSEVNHRFTQ